MVLNQDVSYNIPKSNMPLERPAIGTKRDTGAHTHLTLFTSTLMPQQ